MAFLRTAKAQVAHASTTFEFWEENRVKSNPFNSREASKVLIGRYDPKEFLLTHCTIVASVDTQPGPGQLGRQMEEGIEINRLYPNYYITPGTQKYINNNNDAFERKLLLGSFPTFVGAENYLEHVQMPELSKGKIIDAVARDVGDSIYIDILVGTNRRHKSLVAAIQSSSLSTLSMGATVAYTICSKCGNVAHDETELCFHIRHQKGNTFIDAMGNKLKIAELCGSADHPESVHFIEASWVGNPAFKGAVLRNILSEVEADRIGGSRISLAFSQPTRVADTSKMQRAAKAKRADFGMDEPAAPPKADKDPMTKAIDDLANSVREHVVKRIREDIDKDEVGQLKQIDENRNESLIKSAIVHPEWKMIARKVIASTNSPSLAKKVLAGLVLHKSGGWAHVIKVGGYSGRELLAISRILDGLTGRTLIAGETRVYRTVIAVGGMGPYEDIKSYLSACRHVVGRDLSSDEQSLLIDKGRLFALGS